MFSEILVAGNLKKMYNRSMRVVKRLLKPVDVHFTSFVKHVIDQSAEDSPTAVSQLVGYTMRKGFLDELCRVSYMRISQ